MEGDDEGPSPEDLAYQQAIEELQGMTVEDILRDGQKSLFVELVARCRSGKASHQELAVLRNVLKDNGLTLGIPPEDHAAERQTAAPLDLPDFGEPEYIRH